MYSITKDLLCIGMLYRCSYKITWLTFKNVYLTSFILETLLLLIYTLLNPYVAPYTLSIAGSNAAVCLLKWFIFHLFFLYCVHRLKTCFFQCTLDFSKKQKITWSKIRWLGWMLHHKNSVHCQNCLGVCYAPVHCFCKEFSHYD